MERRGLAAPAPKPRPRSRPRRRRPSTAKSSRTSCTTPSLCPGTKCHLKMSPGQCSAGRFRGAVSTRVVCTSGGQKPVAIKGGTREPAVSLGEWGACGRQLAPKEGGPRAHAVGGCGRVSAPASATRPPMESRWALSCGDREVKLREAHTHGDQRMEGLACGPFLPIPLLPVAS